MNKVLPPWLKVDSTCTSTSPKTDERWYFDINNKTALLLNHVKHDYFIERAAKLKIIGEKLYIQYSESNGCAYVLSGPKSQKEYQMWLATKILEEEVFNEN